MCMIKKMYCREHGACYRDAEIDCDDKITTGGCATTRTGMYLGKKKKYVDFCESCEVQQRVRQKESTRPERRVTSKEDIEPMHVNHKVVSWANDVKIARGVGRGSYNTAGNTNNIGNSRGRGSASRQQDRLGNKRRGRYTSAAQGRRVVGNRQYDSLGPIRVGIMKIMGLIG